MGIQLVQKRVAIVVAQRVGNPCQIVIARGQYMGLLVIQVLDAMLHTAQKNIGARQLIGRFLGHERGLGQTAQRLQRGPAAQLGELAAAHHLQQLHRELNLTDATARQFDVVGPLRMARTAPRRMVANLAVQDPQRIKHAVIQIAPKHKGQHHAAQRLHLGAGNAVVRGYHPALEPGKALPLAPLHLQVFLQRNQ